jgi:hypothetical protein
MANLSLDLSGLVSASRRLRNLEAALDNPRGLMVSWMKILDDGNRRGILKGLGGDGAPLRPVTYRPVGSKGAGLSASQRNLANLRTRRGAHAGTGMHAAGLHNNLTPAEYRRLGGPPLAPRGAFSRVITNFAVDYDRLRAYVWQVTYFWRDVVNTKGVSFLRYHFEGTGRLPRRDLRGIRPDDRALASRAAKNWLKDQVRSTPGG